MFFGKKQTLTHKIETAVLTDLKKNMAGRWSMYRLTNSVFKMARLAFWVTLMGYMALGIAIQMKGFPLPQNEVNTVAEVILGATIVMLVANALRSSAESDLRKYIDARWQIQPK
ncbi:hypothetical protein ASE93_23370 [Serratia sp. Leaf50]|nr:hypothetical protein ASE93_23370 [Serratia sp. Leaf50]